jgi:hypothetical protein
MSPFNLLFLRKREMAFSKHHISVFSADDTEAHKGMRANITLIDRPMRIFMDIYSISK